MPITGSHPGRPYKTAARAGGAYDARDNGANPAHPYAISMRCACQAQAVRAHDIAGFAGIGPSALSRQPSWPFPTPAPSNVLLEVNTSVRPSLFWVANECCDRVSDKSTFLCEPCENRKESCQTPMQSHESLATGWFQKMTTRCLMASGLRHVTNLRQVVSLLHRKRSLQALPTVPSLYWPRWMKR